MAKFVANHNKSAFTKFFLFFIVKNLHFYLSFDIIGSFNTYTYKQIFK